MKLRIHFFFLVLLSAFNGIQVCSQTIPAGFPVLEEFLRREQLKGNFGKDFSFNSRPINPGNEFSEFTKIEKKEKIDSVVGKEDMGSKNIDFKALPLLSTTVYNSNRPFGWGNSGLKNGVGFQNLTSPGIYGKLFFLEIQLRPEFIFSQNKPFSGYEGGYSEEIDLIRFKYWNFGDNPERYTKDYEAYWGQSYASLNFGKFEIGFSTQNIWWGPGQFAGLIFSNNAQGMKHFYLKTKQPADIFIGKLEGQLISARAEDSSVLPSQNDLLNNIYGTPFSGDWRYINGLSLTYQPVFLPQLFIGFNRTFQQYNDDVGPNLIDRFPVFQAFQKKELFTNGNSVAYDTLAQDQQVSVTFRYVNVKAKFEVYGEFGRRDHSYDWREFILNPEHARAYLMGFSKLFQTGKSERFIQIRGEVIHQQESVNRYIRYPDEFIASSTSWHTHYQVRGFTNYGEGMGVGIGVGANAQILEISQVKNLNKVGLLFQRLENHQDFFYRAFGQNSEKSPWVDFSLGFIWEQKWNRLMLTANAQITNGVNYQWQSDINSTNDFPSGNNKLSFSSTINLIYQIGR